MTSGGRTIATRRGARSSGIRRVCSKWCSMARAQQGREPQPPGQAVRDAARGEGAEHALAYAEARAVRADAPAPPATGEGRV
jgi:hypothetical protein